MRVYAVIVTYNGLKWYDRCFSSIQKSNLPVQIIVVDNASSDNSVEYISINYPEIELICSNENLGFAKANNLGIKFALDQGADYIFLLNQDAWINEKETISTLVTLSLKYPAFGILSPLQLYGSGNKIEQEVILHFAREVNLENDFISDVFFNRMKEIYDVKYACAVCWLLPINTIKNIGGFDPLFYHYGEDDNYIQRLIYFGYKIGICPQVSISHDIESRPKEYREQNLNWKKYILINLGDINSELNIKKLLKRKLRSIIIQALRLNIKLLKKSYPEYIFIKNISTKLIFSRTQNKIQQTNWL